MTRTTPFYMFQNDGLYGTSAAHPERSVPPLLDSLELLTSSVVRVSCGLCNDGAAEQSATCRVSSWTTEEKARCVDFARSWTGGAPPSTLGASSAAYHRCMDDACESPVGRAKEKFISLDETFISMVVRGFVWKSSDREGGVFQRLQKEGVVAESDEVDIEIVRRGVRDLCRVLQQRYDQHVARGESVVETNGLQGVNKERETKEVGEEEEEEEARRVFAIMAGASGKQLGQSVGNGRKEPFLVGLVCREQDGHLASSANTVRLFDTSNLICSRDGPEDMASEGSVENGEEKRLTMSVMLLEVDVTEADLDQAHLSSMWKTMLSVVDFVYVTGRPAVIDQVAFLMNNVFHTTVATDESMHFNAVCSAQPPVCPLFFYTASGEVSIHVEQCPGQVCPIDDLPSLLVFLLRVEEPRRLPCSRDLLQWLLLLEHVWHVVGGTSDAAVSSSSSFLQERMNTAITAAVDMFVSTSEGLLLAMRAMEPLPPLLVRGSVIGRVRAAPRCFTLEDALHVARRVALLSYETDVAPCVFDARLASRSAVLKREYCGCRYHKAREELYAACQSASDSLKERLHMFTTHCAVQALKPTVVVEPSFLDTNGSKGALDGDCFVHVIENYADKVQQFLASPLISHYGVEEKSDKTGENGATTTTTLTATTKLGVTKRVGGRHCLPDCRMMESPIILPWVHKAKAVALSQYVQHSLFPALLCVARQYESALSKKEIEVSEARGALFLMENQCEELQRREKRAEVQQGQQRTLLREVKQRSDILSAKLHESCKCLQKLVTTCVGYNETHNGFIQKWDPFLKHDRTVNDTTLRFGFENCPQTTTTTNSDNSANMAVFDSLVVTPPKDIAAAPRTVNGNALTTSLGADDRENAGDIDGKKVLSEPLLLLSPPPPSSSSSSVLSQWKQTQLLRTMLRDAHQQLEACHNVVLCLYQDVRETLWKLSTAGAECTSVNLNDPHQSFLSTSLQAARSTASSQRCVDSVDVSFGDTAGEGMPVVKPEPMHCGAARKDGKSLNDEAQMAMVNTSARSSLRDFSGLTCVSQDTVNNNNNNCMKSPTNFLHTRQNNGRMSGHHLPFSSSCSPTVSLLHTPNRATTAAVDALADLQRQRQEAVEALACANKRCEVLERQLEEERSALRNARHEHAMKEQQWSTERQTLLNQLHATVGDTQLAQEKEFESRQKAELWAQSWTEVMAVAETEAQMLLSEGNGAFCMDDNGNNGKGKTSGNGTKDSEHIAEKYRLADPHETLRVGQAQLRALVACAQAVGRDCATKAAEQDIAKLQLELANAKELELQNEASAAAAFRASEEVTRLLTEVDRLQKAFEAVKEQKDALQFERDRLALSGETLWRRLHHLEAAYAMSFDVWNEAMLDQCGLIWQQWGAMTMDLCAKNHLLIEKLKLSQEEARRWEETVYHHADAIQKAAEEVTQLAEQLEQHRVVRAAAEGHVSLLYRRMNEFSTAYVASFVTWEDAMARRCELLLQQWSLHGPFSQPLPRRNDTAGSEKCPLRGVEGTYDPCGLRRELQQKKHRIAELEEALRQKKLACTTLTEAVCQLNALLNAQRELGMTPPPPPPLVSAEFGVLSASDAGTMEAAPLVSTFYASLNHPGGTDVGTNADSPWSVKNCHTVTSAGSQDGAKSARRVGTTTSEEQDATEPRSLKWYLQSLSAIESTLAP